jgi:hypothetical protein
MRGLGLALVCSLSLAACGGGDDGATIDAPPGTVDAPPGTPDAPMLSCAAYCTEVMANCTGANVQYDQMTDCVNSCATWMVGTVDDMSGGTLGCRTYHAGAASGNPNLHCRHAGPGGDGACGQNCQGFCELVLGVCTGANQVYADELECDQACTQWSPTPPYSSTVQSGNSFACRLYHATAASTSPGTHCGHTADVSPTCN